MVFPVDVFRAIRAGALSTCCCVNPGLVWGVQKRSGNTHEVYMTRPDTPGLNPPRPRSHIDPYACVSSLSTNRSARAVSKTGYCAI